MVVLLGVLGMIVYKVVAPATIPAKILVPNTDWKQTAPVKAVPVKIKTKAPAAEVVTAGIKMQLEVVTDDYMAVNEYIYKEIILANNLIGTSSVNRGSGQTSYSIVAARTNVNKILDGLESVWGKFKSSKLTVATGDGKTQAAVAGITIEQLVQIVAQHKDGEQINLANDFAVMNRTGQSEPNQVNASDSNSTAVRADVVAAERSKLDSKVERIEFLIKVISAN